MSAPGTFDPEMLWQPWGDVMQLEEAWFDPDMIQATSAPPPPTRHLTRAGVYGLEYAMGYRMPLD